MKTSGVPEVLRVYLKMQGNRFYQLKNALVNIRIPFSEPICNGEECPLANLGRLSDSYDFNSACYTSDSDPTERCFTADVAYNPQVRLTITAAFQ